MGNVERRVVAAARAEADRMRAAVADAGSSDKVDMSVPQFTKLAELITVLCRLIPDTDRPMQDRSHRRGTDQEMMMEDSALMQDLRTLAQIESEMREAESAFADAETRMQQAKRDREAALETINRHQAAIDETVAEMRRRSPAASHWKQTAETSDVLMLNQEESSRDEAALIQANTEEAAGEDR